MKHVKQMSINSGASVGELAREMRESGVLGAGKIGKAVELAIEMLSDPDYTVFLTMAGPVVPGGLRRIISYLINEGYVNVIVTTGANIVHDIVEALGYRHWVGTFNAEDKKLKTQGIGRIGDIYIEEEAFKGLEKWIYKILEGIPEDKRERLSTTELLLNFGRQIKDPESILSIAAKKSVPIISPGFIDSIAGFHLWMYGQESKISVDPILDVDKLMNIVYESKKVGIIILGGGWPKHFALFGNTFRDGVDCAIQIIMDRAEPGGLSGAPLEEAISWGKVKPEGKIVTVICDLTIAFPLIVAATLEGLERYSMERTAT